VLPARDRLGCRRQNMRETVIPRPLAIGWTIAIFNHIRRREDGNRDAGPRRRGRQSMFGEAGVGSPTRTCSHSTIPEHKPVESDRDVPLKHVPAKWTPVRRQEHAQSESLRPFPAEAVIRCDSIRPGTAVAGSNRERTRCGTLDISVLCSTICRHEYDRCGTLLTLAMRSRISSMFRPFLIERRPPTVHPAVRIAASRNRNPDTRRTTLARHGVLIPQP
jgi:hypothetical protein